MSPAATKAKSKKTKDASALVDEAQVRRERITLALFLVGAVTIVCGMIVLSTFLSKGADQVQAGWVRYVFYAFLALAVVMAGGITFQKLTGKRAKA